MYIYIYIYLEEERNSIFKIGAAVLGKGRMSEAYKRGRIKRGCSQKPDLQIGGKTGPRHIQNTGFDTTRFDTTRFVFPQYTAFRR